MISAGSRLGPYEIIDVSADGRRFLMVSGKQTAHTQLHVFLDWFGELDRLTRRNDLIDAPT